MQNNPANSILFDPRDHVSHAIDRNDCAIFSAFRVLRKILEQEKNSRPTAGNSRLTSINLEIQGIENT
jgi:hypothetical protein